MMRSFRQRRLLLWVVNVLLLAAVAAAASFPLAMPVESYSPELPPPPSGSSNALRQDDGAKDYTVIYQRPLRNPLYDRVIQEKPKPKPKFTAQLIGTATDPGFTYALFRTQRGEDKLISPGQSIAGATVLEVREGEVTIEFGGERLTLRAQLEGSSG